MFGFGKKKKQAEAQAAQSQAEQASAAELDQAVLDQADATETVAEPVEEKADEIAVDSVAVAEPPAPVAEAAAEPEKKGFFGRLKERLSRTSSNISEGVASLVVGKKAIDADVLDELETQLLTADVGVDATMEIIDDLTGRMKRKQLGDV